MSGPTATLFEVGPRDGLQNEPRQIPTEDKIRLVELLIEAGLTRIEVTSFVSPKWVPQMADGAEVLGGLTRPAGVEMSALTPNLRGYEAARAARVDAVAVFAAASESFSQRNINCSIDESLERFAPVLEAAKADGIPVRGYISCVTDCPYEGTIAPSAVARVAARLRDLGCAEISLGDTIGKGTPEQVDAMLAAVLSELSPGKLAGHFHDTGGRAIENVDVAIDRGLRVFDAACGGLGGCPYAPGAAGNVASEAVAARLAERGFQTGIDRAALERAARFARALKSGGSGDEL